MSADGQLGGNLIDEDGIESTADDLPAFTIWDHSHLCFCIPVAHIPALNRTFIGHWEVLPCMPLVVLFLVISSYVLFLTCALALMSLLEAGVAFLVLTVILGFMGVCYFQIIYTGPGYFPYYYRVLSHSPIPDDAHDISGILSTQEQVSYIETHPAPPRSIFSRIARRYVLRPDHFCHWTASWIGKMNLKFFILFCFHGSLYTGFYCGYAVRLLLPLFASKMDARTIILAIYGLMAFAFFIAQVRFLIIALCNAAKARTNWEIWNSIDSGHFNTGSTIDNFQDVMGPDSKWMWLCPFSPWGVQTPRDLAEPYLAYRDVA
jgi:hypothetical protein